MICRSSFQICCKCPFCSLARNLCNYPGRIPLSPHSFFFFFPTFPSLSDSSDTTKGKGFWEMEFPVLIHREIATEKKISLLTTDNPAPWPISTHLSFSLCFLTPRQDYAPLSYYFCNIMVTYVIMH